MLHVHMQQHGRLRLQQAALTLLPKLGFSSSTWTGC